MSRPFVRDVCLVVVEFLHFAEVLRDVVVAEASLLGTFGLRRRAGGILVRIERESRVHLCFGESNWQTYRILRM